MDRMEQSRLAEMSIRARIDPPSAGACLVNSSHKTFRGKMIQSGAIGSVAFFQTEYRPYEFLAEHCHERAYVSVVLCGSYREESASGSWECRSGEAAFHIAGEQHSDLFHENGARTLSFEMTPQFLNRMREFGLDTTRRVNATHPACIQLGRKLIQEATSPDPVSPLAAEGLILELIAEIFRPREQKTSDWLEQVRQALHSTYREPRSLFELSREVRVHPAHLARAFRNRFGSSIGDYVRMLRVEAARGELENSNAPIVEIAARTGFADQSHLCRIMKKLIGLTPRDVRAGRRAAR